MPLRLTPKNILILQTVLDHPILRQFAHGSGRRKNSLSVSLIFVHRPIRGLTSQGQLKESLGYGVVQPERNRHHLKAAIPRLGTSLPKCEQNPTNLLLNPRSPINLI